MGGVETSPAFCSEAYTIRQDKPWSQATEASVLRDAFQKRQPDQTEEARQNVRASSFSTADRSAAD